MSQNDSWNNASVYEKINAILNTDSVLISSTDTVLGLLAPLTKTGYQVLDRIKGRSNKPYLILAATKEKAAQFSDAFNHDRIKKICEAYWPGPLTIIVPAKKGVPDFMKSAEGTIAIRVPDHAGLQKVLKNYDGLFSTSANKAGEPIPHTIDQLHPDIMQAVDLVVVDEAMQTVPSTIIDCTGDEIKLVRSGVVHLPQNFWT